MKKNSSTIIKSMRTDFYTDTIDVSTVNNNPFVEFEKWMQLALAQQIPEPNAMNLATVSGGKRPSSRIVLLRGFDKQGFVFFSNYQSKKGSDLTKNRLGALNFFWPQLSKQIRIEGSISKTSKKVSDDYFNSRPVESRLGAWASNQSKTINSRKELEQKIFDYAQKYGKKIPRPPHWGGYVLKPDYFEFWSGQQSRLHDRIVFKLVKNKWRIFRIAP